MAFRRYALVPAFLLAGSLHLMSLTGLEREALPTLALFWVAAFAAFLWAWRSFRGELERTGVIIVWAVIFRALLLPTIPDLSDDAYRYVWDGWVFALGVNPYAWVPLDGALAEFRDGFLLERLNSPEYHTVYPPFSQLVFFFGGVAYELLEWPAAFYVVKGLVVLAEVVGIALIIRVLRAADRPVAPVALYAWNPLVLVTVAGNGHSEGLLVLGIALLAAGVYRARAGKAGVGLVLAGMTKLLPFAAAPLLARHALENRFRLRLGWGLLAGGAVGGALLAPFWFPGMVSNVASSLELYARHFEFNAGLYLLLREIGLHLTGTDHGAALGPALLGVFVLWLVAIVALHRCGWPEDFFRAFLLVVTGFFVLATTVHPWYLNAGLILLPFTTLLRRAWLWASFAAFATYFTYLGVPHGPLAALVWVGFFLVAALEVIPSAYQALLRRAGARKARLLEPHIRGNRVLDLGAGEGYVARKLARGERRLFMADVARFFRVSLPAVMYDGHRLPFPDRSFDTVVVALTLHHARQPQRVVEEALRTGSRVVVTESVARGRGEARRLAVLDRAANRFRGDGALRRMEGDLHFRDTAEWEELFRSAGGRVMETSVLNRFLHHHVLFVVEPGGEGEGAEPAPAGEAAQK